MEDSKILTEIAKQYDFAIIKKYAKEAVPNFSFNNDQQVWDINYIAYWMYILEEESNVLAVANIIINNKDKVLKDDYREMLVLQYHVYKNKGDIQQSEEIKSIIYDLFFGEQVEFKRAASRLYNRYLSGELLYDKEIKYAQDSKDFPDEIWTRFRQLRVLLFMDIFGGSEVYPSEKIKAEIQKEKTFLKENIANAK